MTSNGYKAEDLISALACARRASWLWREPVHIIDRDGALEVVRTICASDEVVARGIIAARRTREVIATEVEAMAEINRALPYIQRAAEIIAARGHTPSLEAEEIVADLIGEACRHLEVERRLASDDGRHPPRKTSFTRMFGGATYG